MRRILYYSLVCLLWVSVDSCKDDEASQPPTPTFTVNRTSGLYNTTDFVFTIDQVGANAVSLLPYGADHVNDAGILIPVSSFTNGKATVTFRYGQVGTFNAVVVANNHTNDGLSVKNTISSPTAITITSERNAILDFTFEHSTKTVIDTVNHTITVTVPAGTDPANIAPTITKSDFSSISPADNKDFTSDVVYTVTPQNGGQSQTWTVHVIVTPRETTNLFKSFQGIESSTVYKVGRVLPADIDVAGNKVVIYDVAEKDTLDPAKYDSVAIDFALAGGFAYAEYGTYSPTGTRAHGKDTLDFNDAHKITIVPQDSAAAAPGGPKTYDLYFRIAPKLIVSLKSDTISNLYPAVMDTTTDFALNLDVTATPALKKVTTDFDFVLPVAPAATTTIGDIEVIDNSNDATYSTYTGKVVDFTKPVKVKVEVTQDGITFWATYTVTVTVVN